MCCCEALNHPREDSENSLAVLLRMKIAFVTKEASVSSIESNQISCGLVLAYFPHPPLHSVVYIISSW